MAIETLPPEIRLAKVGSMRKKEKKRGALMAWWMSPAGIALKTAVAKVVVALLVGSIGVAAHLAGKAGRPAPGDYLAGKKKALFAPKDEKQDYGSVPGLPSDVASRGDSLSMIAGSMDGKTDAQRAAEAAAAQAAANPAAAAVGADGKPDKAAVPNVDPAALMAQAAASAEKDAKEGKDGKPGKFGKKIGELSSNFGGSSSGLLAGGAGLSGGSGGAFKPLGGGGLRALSGGGAVPRSAGVRAHGRGNKAFDQLFNAAKLSGQAAQKTGEAAAVTAGAAFNGDMAGGGSILGSGAGVGGGGVTSPQGGGGNPQGGNGGPTNSPGNATAGGTGEKVSNCDIMSADTGQQLIANGSGGCIPDVNHHDVTPWDKWSTMAQIALAAGALFLAIGNLALSLEKSGTIGAWARYVVYICAGLAMASAVAAIVAGIKIFGMGGQIEGVMDLLGGAMMGVMAYKLWEDQAQQDQDAQQKITDEKNAAKAQTDSKLAGDKGITDKFAKGSTTQTVDPKTLTPAQTQGLNGTVTGVQQASDGTVQISTDSGTTRYISPSGTTGQPPQVMDVSTSTTNGQLTTTYTNYNPPGAGGVTSVNNVETVTMTAGSNPQVASETMTSVNPDGSVTKTTENWQYGTDNKPSVQTNVDHISQGASGYQSLANNPNNPPGTTTRVVDSGGNAWSPNSQGQQYITQTNPATGAVSYFQADGTPITPPAGVNATLDLPHNQWTWTGPAPAGTGTGTATFTQQFGSSTQVVQVGSNYYHYVWEPSVDGAGSYGWVKFTPGAPTPTAGGGGFGGF